MTDLYTGTPATTPPAGGGLPAALLNASLMHLHLTARRISAEVTVLWEGPQLVAYLISPGLGEDVSRIHKQAESLGGICGAGNLARMSYVQDGRIVKLVLEVPKPLEDRKALNARRLDVAPKGPMTIPIGVSTGNQVIWFDFTNPNTPHLLIAGTTGSGKTTAVDWLIYYLATHNSPHRLRLIMLDPKQHELQAFEHIPHLLHPIASKPLEMTQLMQWCLVEMADRAANNRRTPRLLIVLEELEELLELDPNSREILNRLAKLGRTLGISVIGVTHQPGAQILGRAIFNFPARLVGMVASGSANFGATGKSKSMVDQLLGNGDFLLIAGGTMTRLQMPLIGTTQKEKFGTNSLETLPYVAQVDSLADQLPQPAFAADLVRRDRRGGSTRAQLSPDVYEEIAQALAEGASPDDLRKFGIGYVRAKRMADNWKESVSR